MMLQNKSISAVVKVITFNDILSPLMLAIAKQLGVANSKKSCDVETLMLAKLVENVVNLTNKYIENNKVEDENVKWNVAVNISRIVAANYKNTQDILESDFAGVNLEEVEIAAKFVSEEDFKNAIFEAMSPIVNVVKRFNFALEEEKIISGAEKHISIYADNLFEAIYKDELGSDYFNALYIKTMKNLSDIFGSCYYNSIDATLSVPKEKREPFIQKNMIDTPNSVEKMLDCFYSRVSIISNISVSLNVPVKK